MRYGVFGNYGHSNIGDEAILRGILSLLDGKEVNVYSDNLEASKLLHLNNCNFVRLKPAIRGRYYMIPVVIFFIIKNIIKNDSVIVGGGGLFNDINRTAFFQYIFIIILSRLLCKKVFILGVSIGPLNSKFLKLVLKISGYFCHEIYLRDAKSINFFSQSKAKIIPDLSLGYKFLSDCDIRSSDTSNDYIVSISVMDITKTNSEHDQTVMIDKISEFIKKIHSTMGNLHVQFIAMDFEKDLEATKGLIEECHECDIKCTVVPVNNFSTLDLVFVRSNFVIATRLHAAILATLYGVPFMSIAYQEKVKNYFKSHNIEEPLVSVNSLSGVDLFSKYMELIYYFDSEDCPDSRGDSMSKLRSIFNGSII
jgi:polysaccharide pyruvyl transferase WcaK-like protein